MDKKHKEVNEDGGRENREKGKKKGIKKEKVKRKRREVKK